MGCKVFFVAHLADLIWVWASMYQPGGTLVAGSSLLLVASAQVSEDLILGYAAAGNCHVYFWSDLHATGVQPFEIGCRAWWYHGVLWYLGKMLGWRNTERHWNHPPSSWSSTKLIGVIVTLHENDAAPQEACWRFSWQSQEAPFAVVRITDKGELQRNKRSRTTPRLNFWNLVCNQNRRNHSPPIWGVDRCRPSNTFHL